MASVMIEVLACILGFVIYILVIMGHFSEKRKITWWKMCLWGGAFTLITYFEVVSNFVASLLGMLLCIAFAVWYRRGSMGAKVCVVLISNVFVMATNMVCIQLISAVSGAAVEQLTQYGNTYRLIMICLARGGCLIAAILYGYLGRREQPLQRDEIWIALIFSGSFFAIAFFFLILMVRLTLTPELQIAFAMAVMLLMTLTILVLILLMRLHRQNEKVLENKVLQTQIKEQERRILAAEQGNRRVYQMRHDIKRYFTNYLYLLEQGQVDRTISEMRKTFEQNLLVDPQEYTDDVLLNGVINEKRQICEQSNISFNIHVQLPESLESVEMAVVLSNLLDNAIEAEQHQEKKEISLYLEVLDQALNLLVSNRIEKSVLQDNPNLRSTRKDKKGHGIGLLSVQEIVTRKQGIMNIEENKGEFQVHIIVPVASII